MMKESQFFYPYRIQPWFHYHLPEHQKGWEGKCGGSDCRAEEILGVGMLTVLVGRRLTYGSKASRKAIVIVIFKT